MARKLKARSRSASKVKRSQGAGRSAKKAKSFGAGKKIRSAGY